ncbi:S1 family peptidase [Cupriavidus sp. D39]|uniref:S1 family peptidase n=1 Tax=Cupriavidus sp. D39 TaxID=2997877 RepID=UPI00226E82D8|nr:serine protease [Cupriavidus sp. D39]MCY0856658.1 serine protease [Cupriavidus sp. D39]
MTLNASITYRIVRSTVRLMACERGIEFATGTGFFYKVERAGLVKVLILTNKHVVEGADTIRFVASTARSIDDLDEVQQPRGRLDQTFEVPLSENVHLHPDSDIDLCGIDVTVPFGTVFLAGLKHRSLLLDSSWIASGQDHLGDIEPVAVIGYPNGIWDSHNNMPVSRMGTTATHPLASYQNGRNFLLDVAIFHGSSGSPVFLYESPFYASPDGSLTPGTRVRLLGVVWGALERTDEGEVKVEEIPTSTRQVAEFKTSLNLGVALHASAIKEIDALIFPPA